MPPCKHHEICGLDALEGTGEDLCILHSHDPEKDKKAFDEALAEHRKKKSDFRYFVYPGDRDFSQGTFTERADFSNAEFTEGADFAAAEFTEEADFNRATFTGEACFGGTTFTKEADFRSAHIKGRAFFIIRQGDYGSPKSRPRVDVDFRYVIIEQLDVLSFRDADLTGWRFLGTDLRKAEFANVTWPREGGRFRVYDEDVKLKEGETREWSHVEHLYRQLKQNYEDRKDYERASDFHYGEKEMRRKNPETPRGLWCWLTLYWLVSGYGERGVRPLIWVVGLLAVSTFFYQCGFIQPRVNPLDSPQWWETCFYSLKVMILLKPRNLVPVGLWGDVIHTLESILGPIILGLFALAVRQRLKR